MAHELKGKAFKDRARKLLLEKLVRQNAVTFSLTEIVTVKIPAKLRDQGERMRMPVRVYAHA